MRSLSRFFVRGSRNFSFSFLDNEGGDIMDYLTWNDAIQIALLVFAILSCFSNKKKITASVPNKAIIFIIAFTRK